MNAVFLELPRRSLSCRECTKALTGEQYCMSRYEDGQRCDYCSECWQKTQSNAEVEKKTTPYTWKVRIAKKIKEQNLHASKEAKALAYLKDIVGCHDKAAEQFCLALFLMRKKLIQLRKEIDIDSITYNQFEVLETGEMLIIPKIPLSKLDSHSVQTEIAMQLSKADS